MNSNTKGNIALGQAIAYFTEQEYTISIPLNDCQWYDLIIEKNNIFQTVQVKYTSTQANSGKYICSLTTINPTTGTLLYSVVDKPIDLLFIYCVNGNKYLIPVKEIPNHNSITLYENNKHDFANLNTFNTYEYLLNKKEEEKQFIENITPAKSYNITIKQVLQYDLEGNFIKEYKNCSEAARQLNIKNGATGIGRVCRGERKTAYGFQWKYKT